MTQDFRIDRRRILTLAVRAPVLAGATAAIFPGMIDEANAYDPGRAEMGPRYKADSPDVQAFYRSNGYETLKK